MTTHLGQDGLVKVNHQAIAQVRSWTLNTAAELVDASVMGNPWKIQEATLKSWHGSLSCFLDNDNAGQNALSVGSKVLLQLYPSNNQNVMQCFSGFAFITGLDTTASHSGLIESSITFQGTDALTYGENNP